MEIERRRRWTVASAALYELRAMAPVERDPAKRDPEWLAYLHQVREACGAAASDLLHPRASPEVVFESRIPRGLRPSENGYLSAAPRIRAPRGAPKRWRSGQVQRAIRKDLGIPPPSKKTLLKGLDLLVTIGAIRRLDDRRTYTFLAIPPPERLAEAFASILRLMGEPRREQVAAALQETANVAGSDVQVRGAKGKGRPP